MIVYNGFKPNEQRVTKLRGLHSSGHMMKEYRTKRVGDMFRFRYTVVCQCGKAYSGQTMDRALRSMATHLHPYHNPNK